MAIGGLTGNAGFGGRSGQNAIGGGNNPGGGTGTGRRRRKQALAPPSTLTTRPDNRDKSPVQKAVESILPSGDSPGMLLGITPTIGNFLRKQAISAGLTVGPSTPGLGTGQDMDDETARLLLGEPALPAGDAPVSSPEEDLEQTVLAPSRTRLSLPNVRRRRLSSATYFG